MTPLSVFITTLDNEATLERCLASVAFADEIVVVDSFSTDATVDIARRHGARVLQHPFLGYGPQKQYALDQTTHRWVLLLDADEELSPQAQTVIRAVLERGPDADGYALPRIEQMFWTWSSPRSRLNHFLRLFDKTRGAVSTMPVHGAPEVRGRVEKLAAPFYHYGEVDIHTKVAKINAYSTGLVADKRARGRRPGPWILVIYPPLYFLRLYLFKRNFRNGWAGFIASVVGAFYAFLKYAKLYESGRLEAGRESPPGREPPPPQPAKDGMPARR